MYTLGGGRTTLIYTWGGDRQPLFLSNTITKPNWIKDSGAHLLRMQAIYFYTIFLICDEKSYFLEHNQDDVFDGVSESLMLA